MQCDHWTLPRMEGRIWKLNHRCRNPARFRVCGAPDRFTHRPAVSIAGETPCGVHVRPYLMDNGDSVWKPWIIERLDAPESAIAD